MTKTKKAVVIGTGAGGLLASAYLSKAGFQVEAFEKAPNIGGYLNSFSIKDYHFDPGIHYIGECSKDRMVNKLLSEIGIDVSNLFCEMDPDGFDLYHFPDLEVKMCKGIDNYRDRLAKLFPKEVKNIDRFFDIIRKIDKATKKIFPLSYRSFQFSDMNLIFDIPAFLPMILRCGLTDYASFLKWITSDKKLQAVLSANLGCIGLPPSKISTFLGLTMFHHFINGAFFPKNGGAGLRDSIMKVAESNGAVFRTKSEVKKIIIKNGCVKGVVIKNGDIIEADLIVSAIEPSITFGQLIEYKDLPKSLCRKVINLEPSFGSFYVFLGLKRDLKQHNMGAFNIWDFYTYDMDEIYSEAFKGKINEKFSTIASPNSLKENTSTLAPKDCSTLEIITFVSYEPFSRWDGLSSNKRGIKYKKFKEEIGERIIEGFSKNHPGIIGDIEVKNFATPVTNSFWVNAVKGGAYGPAMSRNQTFLSRFNTKTYIKNLLLAGSGVYGAGIAPCLFSGFVAAKMAEKNFA